LEEKPLSMMAERRWVGSCPMFILDINNNPINKIDPRTLAFFKTRMADGSIKIFCDDVVREMIERT